jgi:hypothetical protein
MLPKCSTFQTFRAALEALILRLKEKAAEPLIGQLHALAITEWLERSLVQNSSNLKGLGRLGQLLVVDKRRGLWSEKSSRQMLDLGIWEKHDPVFVRKASIQALFDVMSTFPLIIPSRELLLFGCGKKHGFFAHQLSHDTSAF